MSTIDLTTINCPWTIIKTKQEMDKLVAGDNLLIIVKDQSFIIDCKVYVNQTGNKLIANWESEEHIYCLLEKL